MTEAIYTMVASLLFGYGLYGVFGCVHLLRKIIAANIATAGVFLLIISTARSGTGSVDPVPQAMVLTGIVISVSITAFALALLVRLVRASGRASLREDRTE